MNAGFVAPEDVAPCIELHLPQISNMLDSDWLTLAHHLNLTDKDILKIQMEYPYSNDQARAALQLWGQSKAAQNMAEDLKRHLTHIGRTDIVKKHLSSENAISEINVELSNQFKHKPCKSEKTFSKTLVDSLKKLKHSHVSNALMIIL